MQLQNYKRVKRQIEEETQAARRREDEKERLRTRKEELLRQLQERQRALSMFKDIKNEMGTKTQQQERPDASKQLKQPILKRQDTPLHP